MNLPPIDFLSRIVAYPFRAALGRRDPVYYAKDKVPFRFVGLSAGVSVEIWDEDYSAMALNPTQYEAFVGGIFNHLLQSGADSTTAVVAGGEFMDDPVGPFVQIAFYIGDRFATENTVRNLRPTFGINADFNNIPSYSYSAEIDYWEFAGSFRYSLIPARFQPYLKGGYGWSWYRLEDVEVNGVPVDPPASEWVKPGHIWPNVWHIGAGFEYVPWKRVGRFPGGMEVAFHLEYALYTEKLGLDLSPIPLSSLGLVFPTLGDIPTNERVYRNDFTFGATLSF